MTRGTFSVSDNSPADHNFYLTTETLHLGAVKHYSTLRVSGGGRRAGRGHLWSGEHRLLLRPEAILAEDKVGQVARKPSGLEDFHLG